MTERLRRSIQRRYMIDGKRPFKSSKWLRNRRKLAELMKQATGFDITAVPGEQLAEPATGKASA